MRLIKEDGDSFHMLHEGRRFRIAKKALTSKNLASIRQRFAEGGEVDDAVESQLPLDVPGASDPVPDDVPPPDPVGEAVARGVGAAAHFVHGLFPFQSNTVGAPPTDALQAPPLPSKPAYTNLSTDAATPPTLEGVPQQLALPPTSVPQVPPRSGAAGPSNRDITEINQATRDAVAAHLAESHAQSIKAEADVRAQDYLLQRQQEIQQQAQSDFAANQAKADDLVKGILTDKIDPLRVWHDASTGQKLAAAFGMILGGLAAGYAGHPGQNPAADMLNKIIDRDIEAQKDNLARRASAVSFYVQRGHDILQAGQLARADAKDTAAAMLQKNLAQFSGAAASPQAQLAIAQLRDDAVKLRTGVLSQQAETALRSEQIKAAQLQRMFMQQQLALGPAASPNAVELQGGQIAMTRSPKDAEELRGVMESTGAFQDLINQARRLRQKNKSELLPGGTVLPGFLSQDTTRAHAIRSAMIGTLGKLYGLGVLSKSDYDLLGQQVPDVSAITSSDASVHAKLDQLQNMLNSKLTAALRTRAVGYGRMQTPMVTGVGRVLPDGSVER